MKTTNPNKEQTTIPTNWKKIRLGDYEKGCTSMPYFKPSQTVTIKNKHYTAASSDKLTLGEWIDMDATINNAAETSLSDMLAIVCRPENEEYDYEKAVERAKLFREQSCEKMLPVLSFCFAQKAIIQRDFQPLFNGGGSNQPISSGYKNFCNKWGWYKTIADLADGQLLRFDEITAKKVVEVFGFLLYRIDKSHAELEQTKFMQQIRRK